MDDQACPLVCEVPPGVQPCACASIGSHTAFIRCGCPPTYTSPLRSTPLASLWREKVRWVSMCVGGRAKARVLVTRARDRYSGTTGGVCRHGGTTQMAANHCPAGVENASTASTRRVPCEGPLRVAITVCHLPSLITPGLTVRTLQFGPPGLKAKWSWPPTTSTITARSTISTIGQIDNQWHIVIATRTHRDQGGRRLPA